jgi:thiol-disulfide isomerase/thioredoxin
MNHGTRRRLFTWIPIFTIFVVMYVVLSLPGVQELLIVRQAPPLHQPMEIDGLRLPAAMQFDLVDGTTITGASLLGKPVIINLFATWCSPCVAEVPSLERLQAAVEPDARVLFVGLDEPESLAKWATSRQSDPSAFATAPKLGPPLTTDAIPLTIVVDASGTVVAKIKGAWRWDDPTVIEMVKTLSQ